MFRRKTNFHYHRVSPLQTHRCCFGPNSTISAFSWHRAVSFNIIRQNVIFSNNRSSFLSFVWIYLCSNAHESELLLKVIPRKVVLIHVVPLLHICLKCYCQRMPAIMKVDCWFYSLPPKIVPKVQETLAGNMQH